MPGILFSLLVLPAVTSLFTCNCRPAVLRWAGAQARRAGTSALRDRDRAVTVSHRGPCRGVQRSEISSAASFSSRSSNIHEKFSDADVAVLHGKGRRRVPYRGRNRDLSPLTSSNQKR